MVGWQPNYSNSDFIRMDREFRRKARMRRALMRRICCIVYIIITIAIMILIPVGAYWLKNHDFTPAPKPPVVDTVNHKYDIIG